MEASSIVMTFMMSITWYTGVYAFERAPYTLTRYHAFTFDLKLESINILAYAISTFHGWVFTYNPTMLTEKASNSRFAACALLC